MVWRRLPSFLPNLSLKLLPLSEAQHTAFEQTGRLKELAFKTVPSVNKASIADMIISCCEMLGRPPLDAGSSPGALPPTAGSLCRSASLLLSNC
jgi:hypothetical protein